MNAPLNRAMALKARKLAASGLKGKAIGEKLKVSTTEANNLAHLGHRIQAMEAAVFTPAEILLLRSIAKVQRRLISSHQVRSPESKEIAYAARRGAGWPTATGQKRLGQKWNAELRRPEGLNLIKVSGNGYITLTDAGWMVIHAIEAAEEAARTAPQGVAA